MAPRAKSASIKKNRRQLAVGPQRATPIARPRQAASPRRSARLRAKDSSETPVSHAPQPWPVQASPTRPTLISQPARTKRKRSREDSKTEADEPKGEHPAKQPRRSSPPKLELSEKNLQKFDKEEMDSAANNAPALKRSSSRRSIATSSEAETVRSQRSSNSAAYYRYKHLAAAEVYIHTDPPADIHAAINAVVKAKVSEERRAELCTIAQELYDGSKKAVKAAVGEDDFIELFLIALRAMNHSSLCLRAKADWRVEIKPTIQQSDLNLSFLADFNAMVGDQHQEVDDASVPPRKRQQQYVGLRPISPQLSRTDTSDSTPDDTPLDSDTMPPPPSRALDKAKEFSPIKTPRPDISVGIQDTALISTLSSQILDNTRAKRFLEQLQNTLIAREGGGPAEPLLIAVPTQRASDLVFPFAVIEGKAYSTGKQIFEAENQAAVSGASGLKIQLCLNELVKRATSSNISPTPSNTLTPLFFSVCTEGPYHELYAHYTHIEDGVRKFNQTLLEICNSMLLKSVVDFIIVVDNVLRWGTGQFLELVAEGLGKVAKKAGA
ncbi:hypothetical protein CC80DRAFT_87480 [Byssothecium circinans]|uniref:DUF7924 domain-containing protein n=1 Tax=Byssothecium circinans TaxID=147558 RepID=A0A6A5TUZ5_9PLEO|nr:hypothetical protein CC80DRAFT_87480 [Byssothecium circinans]